MTEEEVRERIAQGEGPACAFMPARFRPQALGETLVALANTHGGCVLVGVRSGRRAVVEGVLAPAESRALVQQVAQECVPPLALPRPEVVTVQGAKVLVITVPAGLPQAYHWHGLYLQRIGKKNLPPSAAELRSLLLERSEQAFEALVPDGASLEDLDMARVARYAEQVRSGPSDPRHLLAQRGCLAETPQGLRPTYAGLLLFGRHPQAFLPQAQVLLAHYPGTTPGQETARHEARGTLPEQIQQAEAFLQSRMRRGRMWRNSERVEVTEYPLEAVREAIVNAVAHRDYSLAGDEVRVSMFQDRIEVHSPGRLPGPITVENILSGRFDRNPVIVQVLAEMGVLSRMGHGLARMVALMEEAHLPRPAFHEERAGFTLTLRGPGGVPLGELPADPQALARLGLNERQVRALMYLAEKEHISGRELQELCPEVSPETLRRDLSDLIARGLLLKVGERRATYYILK